MRAGSLFGQPGRGLPACLDGPLEEALDHLQFIVVTVFEDGSDRGVHLGVQLRYLPAPTGFKAELDAAPIDRITLACDPPSALKTVDDPGRGGGMQSAPGRQRARIERTVTLDHVQRFEVARRAPSKTSSASPRCTRNSW